ncbi:MAG: hypothetical protein D6776_04340 [Planctomycetota bacterium]|nr:MAG: hypothetical protein D6776_04340 [Planctomycetota bacterium]
MGRRAGPRRRASGRGRRPRSGSRAPRADAPRSTTRRVPSAAGSGSGSRLRPSAPSSSPP